MVCCRIPIPVEGCDSKLGHLAKANAMALKISRES